MLNDAQQTRFMGRVEMVTESGCWIWTGYLDRLGYGRFSARLGDGRVEQMAHRAAYVWRRGLIADGLEIDHLCRVRCCVNPWHLEAVDHRTNTLRGNTLAARHRSRTHCPRGHLYDQANTHVRRRRGRADRACRACWAEKRAEARADPIRREAQRAYQAWYTRNRRTSRAGTR